MASSQDIALHIIRAFQEAGDPITNLKLQKLLYYVQGWYLGLHGEPAFNEELEAWVHGPVEPGVYRAFREHRWSPIIVDRESWPELHAKLREHVALVLGAYGEDPAYALERRTHLEDPWLRARGGIPRDQESTAVISKASMQKFFAAEAND